MKQMAERELLKYIVLAKVSVIILWSQGVKDMLLPSGKTYLI